MLATLPEPSFKQVDDLIACGVAIEDHCIIYTSVDDHFSFVLARVHAVEDGKVIQLTECCWLMLDLGFIGTFPTPDLQVSKTKRGYWIIGPNNTTSVLNYPSMHPYQLRFLSDELYAEMVSWINPFQIEMVYDTAVELFISVRGSFMRGRLVRAKPSYPEQPSNWCQFHQLLPIPEHYRMVDW